MTNSKLQSLPPHRPWRIAVANIAGGEGKTALSRDLAFIFQQLGQKVALFDLNPNGNLSNSLGFALTPYPTVLSIYQSADLTPLPQPVDVDGISFWPAKNTLNAVDTILHKDSSKIPRLREAVDQLQNTNPFDIIIFDTKSEKTNLLASSLAAADHVITPIAYLKSVGNVADIKQLIQMVKIFTPNLDLRMIVPMQHQHNIRHHRNLLELIKKTYGSHCKISSPIRYAPAKYGDAEENGISPAIGNPSSEIANDLNKIASELIKILQNNDKPTSE